MYDTQADVGIGPLALTFILLDGRQFDRPEWRARERQSGIGAKQSGRYRVSRLDERVSLLVSL